LFAKQDAPISSDRKERGGSEEGKAITVEMEGDEKGIIDRRKGKGSLRGFGCGKIVIKKDFSWGGVEGVEEEKPAQCQKKKKLF